MLVDAKWVETFSCVFHFDKIYMISTLIGYNIGHKIGRIFPDPKFQTYKIELIEKYLRFRGLCKSESVEIRKSDYIIILFLWFLSETQAKINQRWKASNHLPPHKFKYFSLIFLKCITLNGRSSSLFLFLQSLFFSLYVLWFSAFWYCSCCLISPFPCSFLFYIFIFYLWSVPSFCFIISL